MPATKCNWRALGARDGPNVYSWRYAKRFARLLLLVNYCPEYEHRWGSKTAYSQLRLDSHPAESAAELLAALLGADPGLAPLTQMLVKRGNPFFLEETVRTLVERWF